MTPITIPKESFDAMRQALDLLEEVSQCFTREDDLPNNLIPRIDAALAAANAVEQVPSEDTIATPKETWDDMRDALAKAVRQIRYNKAAPHSSILDALAAAEAVQTQSPKIEIYGFRWNEQGICKYVGTYDDVLTEKRPFVAMGSGKIVGLVAVELDSKGNPV